MPTTTLHRSAPAQQLIDAAFAAAELPFHAICGDWPYPWTGAEFQGNAGAVRAYTEDTAVVVVAFDPHGVELARTVLRRMPVDAIAAILLAAVGLVSE